jgi:hypothetical protein
MPPPARRSASIHLHLAFTPFLSPRRSRAFALVSPHVFSVSYCAGVSSLAVLMVSRRVRVLTLHRRRPTREVRHRTSRCRTRRISSTARRRPRSTKRTAQFRTRMRTTSLVTVEPVHELALWPTCVSFSCSQGARG